MPERINLDEQVCIGFDAAGRPRLKRLGDLTKSEYEAMLAILEQQHAALQADMIELAIDARDDPPRD